MSKRYWIFAVAFGLIWLSSLHAQENVEQPEYKPTATQEQSENQSAEDEALTPPAVAAPTDKSGAEHNANAAPQGDKEAYQVPDIILGDGWAQWAMAILGFFALLVSVWAVWLIKQTLASTNAAVREAESATAAARESLKITREIGEAQVRAYLSFEVASPTYITAPEGNRLLGISFRPIVKNTGLSPALFRQLICKTEIFDAEPTHLSLSEIQFRASNTSIGSGNTKTFFNDILGIDAVKDAIATDKHMIVVLIVDFLDIFGSEFREAFVFRFAYIAPLPDEMTNAQDMPAFECRDLNIPVTIESNKE